MANDYKTYKLGNFKLQSGETIPDAFIAYQTFGDSSLPALIFPTFYTGRKSHYSRASSRFQSLKTTTQ